MSQTQSGTGEAAGGLRAPVILRKSDYDLARNVPGYLTIMLVEDNPSDVLLLREALRSHDVKSWIFVVEDGDEAIRLVEEIDGSRVRCPDLIVLDLNLPKKTGFEVLQRLRASAVCGEKPIVILSSSGSQADRDRAARLGASRYIQKPSDLKQFMVIGGTLKEILTGVTL